MQYITTGENQTFELGRELASSLMPGDIVALYGNLGAGKTVFARGISLGLGISAPVTSPTYTIVNEYDGPVPLFHFDMYRLGGSDELFDIGWEDYLARGGICVVEWSERVSDALKGSVEVRIERLSDEDRRITITGGEGFVYPGS